MVSHHTYLNTSWVCTCPHIMMNWVFHNLGHVSLTLVPPHVRVHLTFQLTTPQHPVVSSLWKWSVKCRPCPFLRKVIELPAWGCHAMGTLSALLALCEGNPPVTGGFPSQRTSDAELCFFVPSLNKLLNKQIVAADFRCHEGHVTSHVHVVVWCGCCGWVGV